jgi:hypothetical protein
MLLALLREKKKRNRNATQRVHYVYLEIWMYVHLDKRQLDCKSMKQRCWAGCPWTDQLVRLLGAEGGGFPRGFLSSTAAPTGSSARRRRRAGSDDHLPTFDAIGGDEEGYKIGKVD